MGMIKQFVGGRPVMIVSAARYLKMYRDEEIRKNIMRVEYVPGRLGSGCLGKYKVTMKYEYITKWKFTGFQ